jgi:hypothetical protein
MYDAFYKANKNTHIKQKSVVAFLALMKERRSLIPKRQQGGIHKNYSADVVHAGV